MPEISTQTLLIAIQAVAIESRALRQAIKDGTAEPEEYEVLENYQQAAGELEAQYDIVAQTVLNLPPYDELTGI